MSSDLQNLLLNLHAAVAATKSRFRTRRKGIEAFLPPDLGYLTLRLVALNTQKIPWASVSSFRDPDRHS